MAIAPAGIDVPTVTTWLTDQLGLRPPLHFDLLAGGHSNLTYAVTDAAGARLVLRRPPVGDTLATAHDVVREHTIMAALSGTGVPVAPTRAVCTDPAVTGAPFFVMSHVDGVVLRDITTAAPFAPDWRRAASLDLIRTLARMHELDPASVGLGGLARPDGYLNRQLARWHGQWQRTPGTEELPLVDHLHARLAAQVPAQSRVSLVHGDYRFENCILAPDGRVAAVLDWELATLGEPLADLALLVIYWTRPDESPQIFPGAPTGAEGFLTRAEVCEVYAQARDSDLPELDYYLAFSYWKLACISAGVLARYRAQSSDGFEGLTTQARRCAEAAAQVLDRAGPKLPTR